MEVTTEVTKTHAIVTISLSRLVSKLDDPIMIDSFRARDELLKKHPELKVSKKPENLHHIVSSKKEVVSGEWVFLIEQEKKEIKLEEPKSKKVEVEKTTKKAKKILNFKPKSDKVVETTAPEQTDQVKGVEEPTE